ncbi:MAG: TlyA family RNA methyltransferase [Deltaproteobacteria bacterium]|nr:TlyA family RNA methyltransferase [Deltaproteobacteria bacterium]
MRNSRAKNNHSNSKKERLDKIMMAKGLAPSRERAQALIMAGLVLVNEERIDKAGTMLDPSQVQIRLKTPDHPYVSRGGVKLEGALKDCQISVQDKVCLDIGASTGGFTDCLLQKGAKKVYALDVGTAQLHQKLRQDPRVFFKENYNARYFQLKDLSDQKQQDPLIDLVVMDLSFISIKLILPALIQELPKPWSLLSLIKPQFEVGPEKVEKGGLVLKEKIHQEVLTDLESFTSRLGLDVLKTTKAVIKGEKGNQEFFLYAQTPRP